MKKYELEKDLCADFAAVARGDGWTVYPEQGGWDLLLVRGDLQVGVQAKKVANLEVLAQALEDDSPHYRAVLVGRYSARTRRGATKAGDVFRAVAAGARVLVFEPPSIPDFRGDRLAWGPRTGAWNRSVDGTDLIRYLTVNARGVWLPPYVPDHLAGVPNPRTVSAFKIAACELEYVSRTRGWVCLDDARSVTANESGSWNPRTLLSRYYVSTAERVREGSRQVRWKRRRFNRASKEFPDVWNRVIDWRFDKS